MKYIFSSMVTILLIPCCTPKECRITTHDFVIPVSLTPAKDTFRIGDTISVVSEFSNQVYDKSTDNKYFLDNFRFFPKLFLREISDTVVNEAGILDFEVIIDSAFNFHPFYYSDGAVSYLGQYSYDMENYSLKYKLIPRKAGLYYFSHFSGVSTKGENQDFPGKCRGKGIRGYVQTNEGGNNNIDLLSDSPMWFYNESLLADPAERFHKFGGYCFYVK